MISTINRDDLDSLLTNCGQHELGVALKEVCSEFDKIDSIDDIARLWKYFRDNFKQTKETHIDDKFSRTSEELVACKIWSGCSNVGTILAPILRSAGIPTIYVQTARLDWIKDLLEDNESKKSVRGHIFLEIYLGGKWILFDSTAGILYLDYDFSNLSLPKNYYAYSKSLTGYEVGSNNFNNMKEVMFDLFKDFNLMMYQNPDYQEMNLEDIAKKLSK